MLIRSHLDPIRRGELMRFSLASGAVGTVLAISLLSAGSAAAATEFGDSCSGDGPVATPYTVTTLFAPPASLPLTAPTSGVITKVKVRVSIPLPLAFPEQVKLLKPVGGNSFTVTNQTNLNASTGLTEADARMPVAAGEQLAMHGLPFTYAGTEYGGYEFFCSDPGSILGLVVGDVPPGSTADFEAVAPARVPLAAIIEPDADGDGFGDETQDACPQSAAVQVACPVVTLSTSASAFKKRATVLVTGTTAANVSLRGVVGLGKGKKAKFSGGTKAVAPGAFTKFNLKFPAKLKKRLKELLRNKKLTLKIVSSAPNIAAEPTKQTIRLKLKGQAPKR
jgi:hypothetical protein